MQIRQCDRCKKLLDNSYEIPFHLRSTDVGTKTLCKPCVERLKRILIQFWKVREEMTREKVGIPEDIPHDIYKYNIMARVSSGMPHAPIITNEGKPKEEPKHEGRRPTNIFSKLFYMLFFEKVDPND